MHHPSHQEFFRGTLPKSFEAQFVAVVVGRPPFRSRNFRYAVRIGWRSENVVRLREGCGRRVCPASRARVPCRAHRCSIGTASFLGFLLTRPAAFPALADLARGGAGRGGVAFHRLHSMQAQLVGLQESGSAGLSKYFAAAAAGHQAASFGSIQSSLLGSQSVGSSAFTSSIV